MKSVSFMAITNNANNENSTKSMIIEMIVTSMNTMTVRIILEAMTIMNVMQKHTNDVLHVCFLSYYTANVKHSQALFIKYNPEQS